MDQALFRPGPVLVEVWWDSGASGAIASGMKLQKQPSRQFAEREYPKWVLVLPPQIVKELGWKEGQELLRAEIYGRSLRIEPVAARA